MTKNTPPPDSCERFQFGANWLRFFNSIDETRIASAMQSLRDGLGRNDFSGIIFLDFGSGSGLFSLAAHRLGATVFSSDVDEQSVACTKAVRDKFSSDARDWQIQHGSVLDTAFLVTVPKADVVYSWGVLHHTGDMMTALANVCDKVAPGGQLFISIYNDQGAQSKFWRAIKKTYMRMPPLRPLIIAAFIPILLLPRFAVRAVTGRLRETRGMTLWYDLIDWLGGYPFEVATREKIAGFISDRGFVLQNLKSAKK